MEENELTFSTLLLGYEPCSFEVVKSENILKFGVTIDNISISVQFPLFQNFDQEAFHVLRLLVSQDSCQVLKEEMRHTSGTYFEELKDLVLPEVLVSLLKDFIVDIFDRKWVLCHFQIQ